MDGVENVILTVNFKLLTLPKRYASKTSPRVSFATDATSGIFVSFGVLRLRPDSHALVNYCCAGQILRTDQPLYSPDAVTRGLHDGEQLPSEINGLVVDVRSWVCELDDLL